MSLRQAVKVAFSAASRGTLETWRTSISSGSNPISRMHLNDCIPKRGFASGWSYLFVAGYKSSERQ